MRTGAATLAELRRLTLQRWCPTCKSTPGDRCRSREWTRYIDFFHEARYGPVRDAWNDTVEGLSVADRGIVVTLTILP